MIIILEGPDNAGKSTLAKKISERLNIEVVHPGGPPKNVAEVIRNLGEQSYAFNQGNIVSFIYDRVTCISDSIYRNNIGYKRLFESFQSDLIASIMAQQVMVVYCRSSLTRLNDFSNHGIKEHETAEVVEFAKANVNRIIADYDKMMESISCIHYDFESPDADAKIAYICNLFGMTAGTKSYTR